MNVSLKDPDEVLSLSYDWAGDLNSGETLLTSAWAVEAGDGALGLGTPPTKAITAIALHTDPSIPNQLSCAAHGFGIGDAISLIGTASTPSVVGAGKVLATPDLNHFTLDDGTGVAVAFTVGGAQAGATAALSALTNTVASTVVSAGTKSQVYSVRNRVTTTQGRTLDRSVVVRVDNR
jgi:hypothetical protein